MYTVLNKLTPRSISQMRACTFLPVLCRVAPDPLKSDLSSSNATLHSTGKNVHALIWLMVREVSLFKTVYVWHWLTCPCIKKRVTWHYVNSPFKEEYPTWLSHRTLLSFFHGKNWTYNIAFSFDRFVPMGVLYHWVFRYWAFCLGR